jgi:acyl dehydratase
MSTATLIAELKANLGKEVHCSDWHAVTQQDIDAFASATKDFQWIHTDPARCSREAPQKSTIAHGFLVLALYPALRGAVDEYKPVFPGVKRIINYGINKTRFPNSVRAGARVRARCTLAAVEEVKGGVQVTENYTLEIEGEAKPGCVGEVVLRYYFE